MKFQHGDKIQIVRISKQALQENLKNSSCQMDEGLNEGYYIGDTGVFLHYGEDKRSMIVSLQQDGAIDEFWVSEEEAELLSDTSNEIALNSCFELSQYKKKVINRQYDTLDNNLILSKKEVTVGCQSISKKDAIQIARDILEFYEET